MISYLPDLLLADHQRIRSHTAELRRTVSDLVARRAEHPNEEFCFSLFHSLKALICAHAKAEEYTLYALFDVDKISRGDQLQQWALEGYEEHDLVAKILKDMAQAEEVSPQWRAQLKVLNELLENHIQQEEMDFLPKVRLSVPIVELSALGLIYLRERDQIFSKKLAVGRNSVNANPASAKVNESSPHGNH